MLTWPELRRSRRLAHCVVGRLRDAGQPRGHVGERNLLAVRGDVRRRHFPLDDQSLFTCRVDPAECDTAMSLSITLAGEARVSSWRGDSGGT